ncbi:MAG: hypothetical protein QOD06_2522, partial [Candidatus Binatota bacterium]|nr:hypothetical protein [Candidatus Binatota bacterium]
SYATGSTDAGLSGATGTFTAISPTADELDENPLRAGMLYRDGDFAWKLAPSAEEPGVPFFPVGDTQWSFAEEFFGPGTSHPDEWTPWMQARRRHGFTSFLGTVWVGLYDRAQKAFPGESFGLPGDPLREPRPTYFRRLDRMVAAANRRGILMGLMVGSFPDNADWFGRWRTRRRHLKWIDYLVARYQAFDVRWTLFGEVNENGGRPTSMPGGWIEDDPDRIVDWPEEVRVTARRIRKKDAYNHPIGSQHVRVDRTSVENPDIDYVEVQADSPGNRSENQYDQLRAYRQWEKPLWIEEYWYEDSRGAARSEHDPGSAIYVEGWQRGIRNTHRNFVHALAFPTMGSLMRAHFPYVDPSSVAEDPGARAMGFFADFYRGLEMRRFAPCDSLVHSTASNDTNRRPLCGRFGDDYALFLQGNESTVQLDLGDLPADSRYSVERMQIYDGDVVPLAEVCSGGVRTIAKGTSADMVAVRVRRIDGRSCAS